MLLGPVAAGTKGAITQPRGRSGNVANRAGSSGAWWRRKAVSEGRASGGNLSIPPTVAGHVQAGRGSCASPWARPPPVRERDDSTSDTQRHSKQWPTLDNVEGPRESPREWGCTVGTNRLEGP